MPGIGGFFNAIGRGLLGGIDEDAYNMVGGPFLGQLLADPNQQPLPNAGLLNAPPQQQGAAPAGPPQMPNSVGAMPQQMSATPQGAPIPQPAPQQPQQWQPTKQQKRAMRAQFLMDLGGGISDIGSGRDPQGIADAMRQYRGDTLNMLVLQNEAQQNARTQAITANFSRDMNLAGNDPEAQRHVLNTYAPYLPTAAKDLGQIAKDYATKGKTVHQVVQGVDAQGNPVNQIIYSDGTIETKPLGVKPKGELRELPGIPGAVYDTTTGMTTPYKALVGDSSTPQMIKGDFYKGKFFDSQGNEIVGQTVTPWKEAGKLTPDEQTFQDYRNAALKVPGTTPEQADAAARKALGSKSGGLTGADLVYMRMAGGDPADTTTWSQDVMNKFRDIKMKLDQGGGVDFKALTALDREVKQYGAPHQKSLTDAQNQIDKINEAIALVSSNNNVAQMTAIPKIISAVAGGQGSGVRVTTNEQNNILHGRGIVGDLNGWLNKVQGKGVFDSTQKSQILSFLNDYRGVLQQKAGVVSDGLDAINGATERQQIVDADKLIRSRIYAMENPQAPSAKLLPQGGGKVIDSATAQQFYNAAGKDPAKARKMATDNGWRVQ